MSDQSIYNSWFNNLNRFDGQWRRNSHWLDKPPRFRYFLYFRKLYIWFFNRLFRLVFQWRHAVRINQVAVKPWPFSVCCGNMPPPIAILQLKYCPKRQQDGHKSKYSHHNIRRPEKLSPWLQTKFCILFQNYKMPTFAPVTTLVLI
ncbi:hypothetical protein UNH65_09820 [Chitinophaga sp. 180180018-2]|nr:hypothetical protein [Chitinophaga sp. 212800010-3]